MVIRILNKAINMSTILYATPSLKYTWQLLFTTHNETEEVSEIQFS